MQVNQRRALFIALAVCASRAEAGCTKDENDVYHCTGISWTARLWIIIGAAVAFILCNILLVYLCRRHYRKKKARLPAAPGARPYERGEYWEGRREYLPGYNPPEALLPSVPAASLPRPSMSMVSSRPSIGTLPPIGRTSTRTSEQPPTYEKSLGQPVVSLNRMSSESTLAEPAVATPAPPAMSIARSGPPLPAYNPSSRLR